MHCTFVGREGLIGGGRPLHRTSRGGRDCTDRSLRCTSCGGIDWQEWRLHHQGVAAMFAGEAKRRQGGGNVCALAGGLAVGIARILLPTHRPARRPAARGGPLGRRRRCRTSLLAGPPLAASRPLHMHLCLWHRQAQVRSPIPGFVPSGDPGGRHVRRWSRRGSVPSLSAIACPRVPFARLSG